VPGCYPWFRRLKCVFSRVKGNVEAHGSIEGSFESTTPKDARRHEESRSVFLMEGAYGLSLPGAHHSATVRWRVPDAGMLSVSIRLEFLDEAFLLKYDGCSGRKIQYGPSRGSDIRFKRSPGGCDASPCRVGDRGIESAGPGNSHTNIFDQKHTGGQCRVLHGTYPWAFFAYPAERDQGELMTGISGCLDGRK